MCKYKYITKDWTGYLINEGSYQSSFVHPKPPYGQHHMTSHESIKTDIITHVVTLTLMIIILYKDIMIKDIRKCPCISCYKSSDPPKLL